MNWIQTPPHSTFKLQSFVELCNYLRSQQLLREAKSWYWQSSLFMVLDGSPLALLRRWFQFYLCIFVKIFQGALRVDAKDSLLVLTNWNQFGCCKDKLIAAPLPSPCQVHSSCCRALAALGTLWGHKAKAEKGNLCKKRPDLDEQVFAVFLETLLGSTLGTSTFKWRRNSYSTHQL